MWTCTNCKEVHEDAFDTCWNCGAERPGSTPTVATGKETQRLSEDAAEPDINFERLFNRYDHAYRFSASLSALGGFIQMAGVGLGLLIVFVAVFTAAGMDLPPFLYGAEMFLGVTGLIFGVVFGFSIYMTGMILTAGSQFLKASLDTAVNTSPFLDQEDKAEIMGISS